MNVRSPSHAPWRSVVGGPVAASSAVRRPPRDGARDALAWARLALAIVLGVRLALSPFTAAVGQPGALWRPRGTGLLFASPPPAAVVIGLQVAGVAGAALYVWRRRLAPLVVAWLCLLLLAGVRTSLGKILHNDVLLLLAAVPLLLAGPLASKAPAPRRRRPRSSSGQRPAPVGACPAAVPEEDARTALDAAAAIVLLSYLAAAWWKLVHTGPAWALSDNLRWALAAGRGGSRLPALSDWLVGHPVVCVALACGILGLEAGAAAVWLRPRLTPLFVAAATAMHAGTWLVLGLDYWAHLATVALVLLPWARMRRR